MMDQPMPRKKMSISERLDSDLGSKRLKVDPSDKENMPFVMQGDTIYIFVDNCQKEALKKIRDICDPISKPQKVHEYRITPASLLRANALGYTKEQILIFFNHYLRNKNGISGVARDLINSEMHKSESEVYMVHDPEECYYKLVITETNFKDMKYLIEENLSQLHHEKRNDINYHVFRIARYRHNDICAKFFDKNMPVRAGRELASFNSSYDPAIYKGKKLPNYCHDITINLKSFTELREYQAEALNSVVQVHAQTTEAKNGYVVLPCGAGKTLLGISILSKIKKQTMVVCSSDSGAEQWKREIEKWTQGFSRDNIIILTSSSQYTFKNSKHGHIYVSTYSALKSKLPNDLKNRNEKVENKWLMTKPWGLVIFDECQTLPASENRQIVNYLSAQVKIGLTATPMREDDEIKTLNYMIGPQLYIGDWKTFVEQGYLANPKCIQIRTKLTSRFAQIEQDRFYQTGLKKDFLYKTNPNKIKALLYLLEEHENSGDQILVFSDDTVVLEHMADKLTRPILNGDSKIQVRNALFDLFRQGKIKTLFLSRIGDEAIDLPNANIAIEVNIQHGSRKQMLQRLGRIMRQKEASSSSFYNAIFYTITTKDTDEWKYFFKRYKCLIDEGFHYDLRLFNYTDEKGIPDICQRDRKERIENRFKEVFGDQDYYFNDLAEKRRRRDKMK